MGLQNWFSRVLMSTWFREISVIDVENLPTDRGSVIVSWHPGGLFDNMLTKGLLPGKQVTFDGQLSDDEELEELASRVALGENIVVFPEGESHNSPKIKQIRDCAAKIALRAVELSNGKDPVIIPVGIHYSKKYYFRERAAITVERPIEVKGSVDELSKIISGEISRASQSQDDWKDRELIWKARSIISAERKRMSDESNAKPSYGEAVLGARRVRAAWEWFAVNNKESCQTLEIRTREHMELIDSYNLRPYDIDSRPKSVTTKGFVKSIFQWLYAWSFMLGFVTISAIIGSFPPFLTVVFFDRVFGSKFEQSKRGAMKLYVSFIVYPIWWILSAWAFTWALLSDSSPIASLADYSMILEFLFSIPAYAVFPLMLWWMPTSGKLQMILYSRGKISWRRMRLWMKWRDPRFDWDRLCKLQQELASDLVLIGDNLVLPGDPDWVEPKPGFDDISSVISRN
ncbi:MAG: hypothetical protein DWC06_04455 [Candidatus Poseidoniales archaeon]|nr:MAG: hypothetical protein DWC06_04455 [Candidatus Poseidoniales archaeon]